MNVVPIQAADSNVVHKFNMFYVHAYPFLSLSAATHQTPVLFQAAIFSFRVSSGTEPARISGTEIRVPEHARISDTRNQEPEIKSPQSA
jgi:hypothetical protein